jgi:hypothetical protein
MNREAMDAICAEEDFRAFAKMCEITHPGAVYIGNYNEEEI